jgi:hypothetical protein
MNAYDGHAAEEYAAELEAMGASDEDIQAAVDNLEAGR